MAAIMNAVMNEATRTAFHILARQQADGGSGDGSTSTTGDPTTEADPATTTVLLTGQPGFCETDNEFDGRLGVRGSAIAVIFVTSLFGTLFPLVMRRAAMKSKLLEGIFFCAKYFGSGVIIATAFIHLLAPANDALTNSCLTGPITYYDWAEGIALMSVFVLFFIEILVIRYANFGTHEHTDLNGATAKDPALVNDLDMVPSDNGAAATYADKSHQIGNDHFGHAREHRAEMGAGSDEVKFIPENYAAQMTALFILEFGVIFHSVFIGLTLAVSGDEFATLYVVLVFHQMFEGLGLGTRLAAVPWAPSKRWTPYLMGLGYAITTPVAIGIGLGVRSSYTPGSQTALITNGVFDSISAGILLYTGLVELMAHEFMFSPTMRRAPIKTVLLAFLLVAIGAGLMALLGRWA